MPELGWCVGAAVGVICAIRWAAAAVYDVLIVKMTTRWYSSVLKDLGKNSTLLDVGIGTATALRNNKSIVDAKDLRVAGVDYDARYIKAAERRVAQDAKLRDRVSVVCASVYDGQVLAALRPKGGFDAARQNPPQSKWRVRPGERQRIGTVGVCSDGPALVRRALGWEPLGGRGATFRGSDRAAKSGADSASVSQVASTASARRHATATPSTWPHESHAPREAVSRRRRSTQATMGVEDRNRACVEALERYVVACGGSADLVKNWTVSTSVRESRRRRRIDGVATRHRRDTHPTQATVETRKEGDTAGTYDVYYFDPQGKRYRSRAEVARAFFLAVPQRRTKATSTT